MARNLDESAIVSIQDLPRLRKKYRNKRIVFCTGCFDLTHAGHVLFFEACKKQGDLLVVCVSDDALMRRYKKGRPILSEQLRLKMVASLKPVDYCFLQPKVSFASLEHINDWIGDMLAKLKPDVYVINDDANGIPRRKQMMKEHPDVMMRILKRTAPKKFENISTSGIIEKIHKIP